MIANPSSWPVVLALTGVQRQFVLDQLEVMWPSHHFHTSFMAADFKFISDPCSAASGVDHISKATPVHLSPNPVGDWLILPENTAEVQVLDLNGKIVLASNDLHTSRLNVTTLPSGLYFVLLELEGQKQVAKMVKH